MLPSDPSVRPFGNEPVVVDHEYPPVPPLAARPPLYAVPTVPFGSDDVVTDSAGAATVMLSPFVAVVPELSFTWTVKLAVPAAVGVPLIDPDAESDRPAGGEPVVVDHE